jgi:two-component system, NtrC family, response regulator AtoC
MAKRIDPAVSADGLTEYLRLLDGSPRMREILRIIGDIADTDATVLIRGESGVGKDVVARAIHAESARSDGPFVRINCAAIPSELLESELFGHERGAFTGAHRPKVGLFEHASNGTMYLDEIGELPLELQAKLLHVLQDFRFARVGGHTPIDVNARIIAATNRDLEHAIVDGSFREDLYYRLNVVEIRVPPLRERKEEIPRLASYFLTRFNAQYRRQRQLSAENLARLTEYSWWGNVRELENVIRRMVLLADGDKAVEHLGAHADTVPAPAPRTASSVPDSLREIARRAAREAEHQALEAMLERVQWNRAEAARRFGVSYKTLLNKIAACKLRPGLRGPSIG